MTVLRCENIFKKYNDNVILHNINLDLKQGRTVGILGVNGCGKSSLLKILGGFSNPTSGSVLLCGNPFSQKNRSDVSFLPDEPYLDCTLSVGRSVELFRSLYLDFDRNRAYELLSKYGIPSAEILGNMSLGNRQKVHLILSVCRRARVYIFDEPLKDVDAAGRGRILHEIIPSGNNSVSIIATQRIAQTEGVFDDVCFMVNGKAKLFAEAESIRRAKNKSIEAVFGEVFGCL